MGGGAFCISYPGRLRHKPYPYSYPSSQLIIHFCLSFISAPPLHISETYPRDIVNSCAFFFSTLRPRSVELETRPPLRTCISTTPHNNHFSLQHIPLPATTQYLTAHGYTIAHYTQHLYPPGNCNPRPRHRVALTSASSTTSPLTHTHTMKLAAICLFSALYAAAYTLASDLQPTIPSVSEEAAPEPTGLTAEHYVKVLE